MMLFPRAEIEKYMGHPVTDTAVSNEMLLNVDAVTRAEVDEWALRAERAGGTVFVKPAEAGPNGWMYLCCFADSEGHRWCVLCMDRALAPHDENA